VVLTPICLTWRFESAWDPHGPHISTWTRQSALSFPSYLPSFSLSLLCEAGSAKWERRRASAAGDGRCGGGGGGAAGGEPHLVKLQPSTRSSLPSRWSADAGQRPGWASGSPPTSAAFSLYNLKPAPTSAASPLAVVLVDESARPASPSAKSRLFPAKVKGRVGPVSAAVASAARPPRRRLRRCGPHPDRYPHNPVPPHISSHI
jgi:hypothetical protein